MASMTRKHRNPLLPVEFIKGVNGLDKVILHETHGSSAEADSGDVLYYYYAHGEDNDEFLKKLLDAQRESSH